ncbi:MAG TPA: DUF2062 domain-containing protein [Methylomirabilota bacterium]|nr:DUF2062 domain-containing protein [Methylomirabilota bacterium]
MAAAALSRLRHALAARLGAVLRLDDPPWRVALALAIGVFISCTPFYGLQTVLSLAVATIFRLNRAVTVTGTWLNLPWFAPILYGFALRIGAFVLPDLHGADLGDMTELLQLASTLSVSDMLDLLGSLSLALLIGTAAVGTVAGAVTYVAAILLLRRRQRRHV